MSIFRQYIAPLLVVLVFAIALLAVSARIFLPADMAAPAPIEQPDQQAQAPNTEAPHTEAVADLPSTLEILVHGLPEAASF